MDLAFENHGSLFLVRPLTAAGEAFLSETAPEDAQFFGNAMAVEPRCLEQVGCAAQDYGLSI